jgi:hypothetical protein
MALFCRLHRLGHATAARGVWACDVSDADACLLSLPIRNDVDACAERNADTVFITANSTAPLSVSFASGTVAGTITIATRLTLTTGDHSNVTPPNLSPATVSVPPAPRVQPDSHFDVQWQECSSDRQGLLSDSRIGDSQVSFHARSRKVTQDDGPRGRCIAGRGNLLPEWRSKGELVYLHTALHAR